MITAVDLFAGCGGLSLGFQEAGVEIKAAFELWETAAQNYEHNFNHPVYRLDLSVVDDVASLIREINPDMILGGPPCQDFSHAGKRIESGRASLTASYAQIISTIRPKYFVMENVDRAQHSNAYAIARSIYKEAGYGLTEILLDASLCGIPQKRKRFFCIGILNGDDDALRTIISSKVSITEMTLRKYFGDKLSFEYYYRHPRNYSRRAIFSIDEPAPTMRGVNRPVPKGYPGHSNDACPLNSEIRALTTMERAMIQTFPDNYVWTGSKTDIEQMIGNAVPVKLAEFVANALLEFINGADTVDVDAQSHILSSTSVFSKWLLEHKNYSERAARDVISRCRRATHLMPITSIPDAYYRFRLEQTPAYQALSVNVRSQMKRSLSLLEEYILTSSPNHISA